MVQQLLRFATLAFLCFPFLCLPACGQVCADVSTPDCVGEELSFVQTGLGRADNRKQKPSISSGLFAHRFFAGVESSHFVDDCRNSYGWGGPNPPPTCKDVNGRICVLCGQPAPTFPEYADGFIVRDDCGNHTASGILDMDRPLVSYNVPPTANFLPPKTGSPKSWTNAWCELNVQKSCADADANRDYFYYAAGFVVEPGFLHDYNYCKHNGYLEEAFVKNIRNYDALYEQSAAVCAARDAEFNISSITSRQMSKIDHRDVIPTPWKARWISAWTCAMGGPGGDIAYCGYTFKKLSEAEDGFCMYPSGPGYKGTVWEGTPEAKRWECPRES